MECFSKLMTVIGDSLEKQSEAMKIDPAILTLLEKHSMAIAALEKDNKELRERVGALEARRDTC